MEVHHHPHVEKKSIKEYLLEGLMIFLAVSLGFLAESFREYRTEHERAKEYASEMLSDLRSDSADLIAYSAYFNYAANNIDTLIQLLTQADAQQVPPGKLYWYGLWGGARRSFVPHDATLNQMKSSGSLRYFTNSALSREVAQYDQLCRSMETVETREQGVYTEVRKTRALIFQFKFNEAANNIAQANRVFVNQARIDSFIQSNPPLLTTDKIILNQYVELIRSRYIKLKVSSADTVMQHATQLITDLKKEYDLEIE